MHDYRPIDLPTYLPTYVDANKPHPKNSDGAMVFLTLFYLMSQIQPNYDIWATFYDIWATLNDDIMIINDDIIIIIVNDDIIIMNDDIIIIQSSSWTMISSWFVIMNDDPKKIWTYLLPI